MANQLTSTVSGASSRWFQQVSLTDPDRVFTGGTVCRAPTFEQAFASPILASLCLTLEAPPPAPDICGEVLVVYQGCADPGGELEVAAKRCGATSRPSDGCASAPEIGRTPPSGLHVWSGAFATAAIAALARRRGGRPRGAVRTSSRGERCQEPVEIAAHMLLGDGDQQLILAIRKGASEIVAGKKA